MKYGIPDEAWESVLRAISRDDRVQGVVLYGSRAKGSFRDGSDIDLCLEAPGLDFQAQWRIENELDDLLLPWRIDLSVRHRISETGLMEYIGRVGKTLYLRDQNAPRSRSRASAGLDSTLEGG